AHDGPVEGQAARRAVEAGVAEAEDAAVGGHQPVAPSAGGGGHAHDGPVEGQAARRAVEAGVAEAEDAAVGGHQPVAVRPGRRVAGDRALAPSGWLTVTSTLPAGPGGLLASS